MCWLCLLGVLVYTQGCTGGTDTGNPQIVEMNRDLHVSIAAISSDPQRVSVGGSAADIVFESILTGPMVIALGCEGQTHYALNFDRNIDLTQTSELKAVISRRLCEATIKFMPLNDSAMSAQSGADSILRVDVVQAGEGEFSFFSQPSDIEAITLIDPGDGAELHLKLTFDVVAWLKAFDIRAFTGVTINSVLDARQRRAIGVFEDNIEPSLAMEVNP